METDYFDDGKIPSSDYYKEGEINYIDKLVNLGWRYSNWDDGTGSLTTPAGERVLEWSLKTGERCDYGKISTIYHWDLKEEVNKIIEKYYPYEKNDLNEHEKEVLKEITEELKNTLKETLFELAPKVPTLDFTRENYDKLFPRGRIKSPIEEVKIGEHQFEKLEQKEREKLLQAIHDTIENPDLIINEEKKNVFNEDTNAHIYAKSYIFENKIRGIQSVIVSIDNENVSISSHERDINNILNKIKKPNQLIYADKLIKLYGKQHTQNEIVQSVLNLTRESKSNEPPKKSLSQKSNLSNHKELIQIKNKLIKAEKIIKTQNDILHGQGSVEVNGIKREFKHGLIEAFPKAVSLLDQSQNENKRLKEENQNLRNQLKQNDISINKGNEIGD